MQGTNTSTSTLLASPKYLFTGIFILGLIASAGFSLLGYGPIAENLGNKLITDRYDDLARGIVYFKTLAYYPDQSASVARAPLYPLLLAVCMAFAGDHFTLPVLAIQAILHGLTALLAAFIALRLSGRKAALLTGVLCALHPLLLWYSGRLVIESLSTFLFTVTAAAAVVYWQRPSLRRAAIVGILVGLDLWCKAVYAPLLIVFPLLVLLRSWTPTTRREALLVVITGLVVIAPWIVRNYYLTGRWPLLQALIGYNLYVSDLFTDNASSSPFGYADLVARIDYSDMHRGLTAADSSRGTAWLEASQDHLLAQRSMERYIAEPAFLLKKIAFNTVWFWTLASSWKLSLVFAFFQTLLLIALVMAARRSVQSEGWASPALIPVWLAIAYLLPHLPVYALARFSVIIIPALLSTAVSWFPGIREPGHEV